MKTVGKTVVAWVLGAAMAALGTGQSQVVNVLVEAEGFASLGGWKPDTMSVEQMGSVYVIAHGMGKPVADATTTVAFPEDGTYRVWVRTRNWVTGNWQAPGRFQVVVNGAELAPVFGTESGAWHWQDGGLVEVSGGSAAVAMRDLSGFDGRCDAIAFVKGSGDPPPAGGEELKAWRRAVRNEAPAPESVRDFDCVVVGGGMAGCCAALAAARSGVQVALVQDRPVLGGNASQEVRVATRGEIRHPIVDEIDTYTLTNRDNATVTADAARLAVIQAEPNISLFMPCRAEGVVTDATSRKIIAVDVRHVLTGARTRLQGGVFIDCSGDGWIGYWAGAEYRMGREGAAEFGESRAPANADAMTMGNSLMWKSKTGAAASTFPAVPWAMEVAGTRADTGGDWNWEYGMHLNTIDDAEVIRDHLLRAIYGNFSNAKAKAGNEMLELDWVPYISGKRESRRLMGDHLLVQSEIVNGTYFEDAVGTSTWSIDLHYPTGVSYLSTYTPTSVSKWYFPFRCLYSRNVPNLMMAGRCLSASHVGLGSPRVQNTTGQMGVAVGYAASLCKKYGVQPRDIYRNPDYTIELQARIGGLWPERPPDAGATVVLDNTSLGPRGYAQGSWTSSNSVTGFYGTDYMHDGNSGKGSKRVVYDATIPQDGAYRISMRWAADANRASNVPVWVVAEPQEVLIPAKASPYIRNGQPTTNFTNGEMLVGRVAANDYLRGLLEFDLAAALPAGAVVLSARLKLTATTPDAASASGWTGADGLRVFRLTQPFAAAAATWNQRASGTAWTTVGGDFAAAHVGWIDPPTDPDQVAAGEVFPFPETGALAAAAQESAASGTLGLIVRTPTLETNYPARKLYRFASASAADVNQRPALVVRYVVPGAADHTVNQRINGGQWVELATRTFAAGQAVSLVVGTAGTNGYVVADGVRFAPVAEVSGYPDLDGDRLPDWWERWHFLSETAADPGGDTDRDGQKNLIEYLTGTDPNSAASRFDARLSLDNLAGSSALRWPSAAGSLYRVERSEDCREWTTVSEHIEATPPENNFPVNPSGPRQFFRVVVE